MLMSTTDAVSTTVLITADRSRASVKTLTKLSTPANDSYSPKPRKFFSPPSSTFQLRNEIAIVNRNGIWVTMIVKMSAGSRGPRRRHLLSCCAGGVRSSVSSAGGESVVDMGPPGDDGVRSHGARAGRLYRHQPTRRGGQRTITDPGT